AQSKAPAKSVSLLCSPDINLQETHRLEVQPHCQKTACQINRTYAPAMNFLDFGLFLAGAAREK
ncbi:MAG: hypothetical protein SNJ50_05655, partial [Cyanobacteriota bacterium]